MKVLLLGVCKDSLSLARAIKSCESYPANGLLIDGVLCKDIAKTTSCATFLNICAYTKPDFALFNADVLFISCPDAELVKYNDFLKEHSIRNKIICHFSHKYDSSVFSLGVTNSVYSIRFPYSIHMEKLPLNTPVLVEGHGRHHEAFKKALESSLSNVKFCTEEEKRLVLIGHRALTCYTKKLVALAESLYKFSDIYKPDSFRLMLDNLMAQVSTESFKANPLDAGDLKKNLKLLSALSYSDTKDFVKNAETHIINNSSCSFETKEELLGITKRK